MSKQRAFEEATQVDLHVQSTVRGKKAVDLRAVLRKIEALEPLVAE